MHNLPCIGSKGVLVVLIALLLILPLIVAHKGRAAEDKVVTALYEAAKKEGGLTIYSPAELVLRGLEKEFAKTFAGIEVRSATVEPTELATKLITEKRSGGVRADLIMGSLRDVVDLLDRGIIVAQDYASMSIPKELVLFDSKLVGIWNVAFAHAYNTNLIKDSAELPKTWNDFLNPKWKGKLVTWDFSLAAGLAWWGLEIGEAAVIDYAQKLVKTQYVLLTRAAADVVNTGERAIGFNGGLAAVFQAQGLAVVPFMFLLMSGAMRGMDPALEEASLVAGGGWLRTLTRVTIPVLRPTMLSVLLLTAIITLESFDIPLLLGLGAGSRVLATSVYYPLYPQIGLPRYGEVAALALSFLVITYILVYLYARATREQARYATVTGKGFRPRQIDLGRWQYVALGGISLYVGLQVVLPAFVLLWSSLLDGYRPPTDWALLGQVSFKAFGRVLDDQRFLFALRNTVVVAALSATLVALLSAVMAWMVVRSQVKGKRVLDLLASTSIAIPSVIAGVSFLMFYLAMPGTSALGLYGTVWVMVLALSYRTTVGYRITSAGVSQIKRELEEAAAVCGSPWLTTFRRVVLPLLLPITLAVWLLTFIVNFRELTIALLLGGVDNMMLGPLLWRYVSSSEMGQASALAVIMAVILLAVGGLARRFVGTRLGP